MMNVFGYTSITRSYAILNNIYLLYRNKCYRYRYLYNWNYVKVEKTVSECKKKMKKRVSKK